MTPSTSQGTDTMTLGVMYLNCRGQTGFTKTKQLIIESEAINKKLDVIHLQEVKIDDKSFESCDFLKNQFQIFANNSENGCYGTCSLVHTKHQTENVKIIPGGRIICLDVNGATLLSRDGGQRGPGWQSPAQPPPGRRQARHLRGRLQCSDQRQRCYSQLQTKDLKRPPKDSLQQQMAGLLPVSASR